jgi:photosystem II stability/assembly factor-like uncharacterized protein
MKVNKTIVIVLLLIVIGGLLVMNLRDNSNFTNQKQDVTKTTNELTQVDSITHAHGMAVDVADPSKLYIATHHGLLVLTNEKELYRVGNAQDDYMGFSPHPNNPAVFFSSGHPSTGGNIGFQKSVDGGVSWEKVSNGINGPVDFHAMTVSPVNPNLIFGWFQGTLQRSIDEGKNWEIASTTNYPVLNLTADPKDENVVFAATPQGLMVSKNKGKDWTTLLKGFVTVIAIDPQDSNNLLSYSQTQKLIQSIDGGENWETVNADFNGETPLYISFNKQNPDVVYLLTDKNSIYKSMDSGESWSKIR